MVRAPPPAHYHDGSITFFQIKSLETDILVALAILRRRINPHESPIYHLHPELLSHIASHLATDDLVKATHISYHWRTVLLAHPHLWSTLDFAHPEQAYTFLARSKSATIHVFLAGIHKNASVSLELLEQSSERIATLQVMDSASQKELLLQTVPSLRKLYFYASHSDVPNVKTRLSLPTLETLFFDGIDPLAFSTPHLTRFTFTFLRWPEERGAIDGLLDFLSSCPLLEELKIFHVGCFYIQRHHDPVHLPRLRAFTHCTRTVPYPDLYHMLSCPPSCSATFSYGYISGGEADILPPFHHPTFHVDARRVKLKTEAMNRQDYAEGVVEVIDGAHKRFLSTRRVVLRDVTWDGALINAINPLYLGFVKGLDARFIETLCVEELALWFYEEGDRVKEVLNHLENIRTLILYKSAVDPYLQALVPITAKDVNEWRCLKLDTLVIYSRYGDYTDGDMLDTLCHVAQERKVAGFPLRSVSMFVDPERARLGSVDSNLEELRRWVETVKFVTGDDILDWNVDDYFLDGLDHIRRD